MLNSVLSLLYVSLFAIVNLSLGWQDKVGLTLPKNVTHQSVQQGVYNET